MAALYVSRTGRDVRGLDMAREQPILTLWSISPAADWRETRISPETNVTAVYGMVAPEARDHLVMIVTPGNLVRSPGQAYDARILRRVTGEGHVKGFDKGNAGTLDLEALWQA